MKPFFLTLVLFCFLFFDALALPPQSPIIPDLPPTGTPQKKNLPPPDSKTTEKLQIPLDGLALRVVPRNLPTSFGVGVKTVTVQVRGGRVVATWNSLDRNRVGRDPYLTDKIKVTKGIVDGPELDGILGIVPPLFWTAGYRKSDDFSALWVSPIWLTGAKDERRGLKLPLLDSEKRLIEGIPDQHYEKVLFLRSLYQHYLPAGKLNDSEDLRAQDRKDLKQFAENFFVSQVIARTTAEVYVNKTRQSLPAVIIGNEYFQIVVLDDAQNPLVLSLVMFPDKVPEFFRKTFEYFKEHMEFVVTQLAYSS